ncbi:YciI family protein [Inquilinus sp. NPDC058860]|uniref:YciI family protein n=1 Tax=Inquilinus sp. NPDC058860 TaxID=3346652 RepID=UPI0036C87180
MKYLCLVYMEQRTLDAMSPDEFDALVGESMANDEEMRRRGQFVAAQALQPTSAATTLRIRGGRVITSDGPFAETKEFLSGFIMIEARDLNQALQLAANIPMARMGSIEVRPVREHCGDR